MELSVVVLIADKEAIQLLRPSEVNDKHVEQIFLSNMAEAHYIKRANTSRSTYVIDQRQKPQRCEKVTFCEK